MRTSVKVGGYVAGLAAIFIAALGVGGALGPAAPTSPAGHGSSGAAHDEPVNHDEPASHDDSGAAQIPGGLQVAQDGYRLTPVTTTLSAGTDTTFRFQITGPDNAPVTAYTPTHDADLHLIVVRRDLTGYQHLHPELGSDGTWSVPLTVPAAGQYRVFADFQPATRTEPLTLGVDLPIAGGYEPRPLPSADRTATVDGYTVTLAGDLVPGMSSELTLTVSRSGAPVTDLQPYLAAYGHLVALRDGDLAYLHVHPDGGPGDGRTAPGPDLTFHAEVPSIGAYRLFLDFQHAGTVRTAEFTARAGGEPSGRPASPDRPESPDGQDGDDSHSHD